GVSVVTVSKRIKKLSEDGWVSSAPYKSVSLTPKGSELAISARERHRQVFEFLLSLGISAEAAEVDAEGIEHHCSEETLSAMIEAVKRGKRD
ncbi:MAG TPA: iron dependent repressor, metal binding and dimerization domain protein, partial [Fimbriimonas sp.]|nr:iron dependent repressor, metal binding and dimerization domain protein [Fimbriimonas sp.]